MRRFLFALVPLLACARSTTTPGASISGEPAYAAREGDSVVVLVHKVRSDNRSEYERFMTEVWFPRAQKFGATHQDFGAALAHRWRLVGTEPGERDSLFSYMFLYPAFEGIGAAEMWRRIGVPEDQIARDSARQQGLIEISDGFAAVRREYSPVGTASVEVGPTQGNSNAEEREIRDLEATWRAALTAKDTAAIERFYADGGYYLPQGSDGYMGSEAIRDRWAGEFTGGEFTLEREPKIIEVAHASDMAYEVGTYKVAWDKPADGRRGGGTGNYVTVWKKTGGEWKTAAYIWNRGAQK